MRRAKKYWTKEQESSKAWGNRLTPIQRGRRRRRTNYRRPVGSTLIRRGGTGRRDSKRPPKAAYQLPPAGGPDANKAWGNRPTRFKEAAEGGVPTAAGRPARRQAGVGECDTV